MTGAIPAPKPDKAPEKSKESTYSLDLPTSPVRSATASPDAVPVPNNSALSLPMNTSIPKESKVKKQEDIEALSYLQKVEKHCIVELNLSRWTVSQLNRVVLASRVVLCVIATLRSAI